MLIWHDLISYDVTPAVKNDVISLQGQDQVLTALNNHSSHTHTEDKPDALDGLNIS